MDFHPVQLEMILATNLRDRTMMTGWLLAQLREAAVRLWPEFMPMDEIGPPRRPVVGYPAPPRRVERRTDRPFMPRWRRRMTDPDYDDDDGGI